MKTVLFSLFLFCFLSCSVNVSAQADIADTFVTRIQTKPVTVSDIRGGIGTLSAEFLRREESRSGDDLTTLYMTFRPDSISAKTRSTVELSCARKDFRIKDRKSGYFFEARFIFFDHLPMQQNYADEPNLFFYLRGGEIRFCLDFQMIYYDTKSIDIYYKDRVLFSDVKVNFKKDANLIADAQKIEDQYRHSRLSFMTCHSKPVFIDIDKATVGQMSEYYADFNIRQVEKRIITEGLPMPNATHIIFPFSHEKKSVPVTFTYLLGLSEQKVKKNYTPCMSDPNCFVIPFLCEAN